MNDDDDDSGTVRGRPWSEGESGNLAGRPKGSRNRMTLKLQELAYGNAEDIIHKITEQALAGDQFSQRLYFDRILPKTTAEPVSIEIPELRSAADAAAVIQRVLEEAAAGEITLGAAEKYVKLVESRLAALEAKDWEQRLQIIENWVEAH
jgi:uncharacterized protein DUF5681